MPRIRSIKPEFWLDLAVCSLSRDARLTTIALISAADDRGRLEFDPTAIRTYAFRRDGLSDKRVRGWVMQVVEAGIALAYHDGGWDYLWLPNFWRHQVINKPSESQLPAHPDDPYGHLPIREALERFREDYRNDYGSDSGSAPVGLPPSRAGARAAAQAGVPSSPFPSSSALSNDQGEGSSARPRKPQLDQSKSPDGFPEGMLERLEEVLAILHRTWEVRGGRVEPQRRGTGLGMMRNLGADHVAVALRVEHWLTAGKGQRASTADIAARFGDWVEQEPAGKRPVAATGAPTLSDLDRRRLESARRLLGGEAA